MSKHLIFTYRYGLQTFRVRPKSAESKSVNSLALHVYLPPEMYIDGMAQLMAPTTDVYRYYYNNIIHEYIDVSTSPSHHSLLSSYTTPN